MGNLKDFVDKYKQEMTITMLLDLANAAGVAPFELLPKNTKDKVKPNAISMEKEATAETLKVKTINGQCYTCDQVAEKYGVKRITVWSWIREGKLNAMRLGRDYRIRLEDLKTFEKARFTKKD